MYGPGPRGSGPVERTIVGVVDDAVFDSQRDGTQPMAYLPLAQTAGMEPPGQANISISLSAASGTPMGLARGVAAALTGVDSSLSFTFRPLADQVDASLTQERLVATLSGIFGGLALLIAALGLYGVTSYAVQRRSSEIGIRMALGAQRGDVIGLVLRQSLALTAVGIVARPRGRRHRDALRPRHAFRPDTAGSRDVRRRRHPVRAGRGGRGGHSRTPRDDGSA